MYLLPRTSPLSNFPYTLSPSSPNFLLILSPSPPPRSSSSTSRPSCHDPRSLKVLVWGFGFSVQGWSLGFGGQADFERLSLGLGGVCGVSGLVFSVWGSGVGGLGKGFSLGLCGFVGWSVILRRGLAWGLRGGACCLGLGLGVGVGTSLRLRFFCLGFLLAGALDFVTRRV